MRVPLPISILLAIILPVAVWWLGTRKTDFLTPPSEAMLAKVRQRTAAALPPAEIQAPVAAPQAPAVPAPPSPEKKPEPAVEIGDLNPNPGLSTYAELAPKGSRHLLELASLLETAGELPRTVLAWERVLDSATAEPPQAITAIAGIRRLRPTLPAWNNKPAKSIPIVLHASTGPQLEKSLKATLEQAAKNLEAASSGILKVTASVTPMRKSSTKTPAKTTAKTSGKGSPKDAPATVALWLSGPNEKSPLTETLSFTVTKPDALHAEILRRIFRLTGNRLQQTLAFPPVAPAATDETPLSALETHITRLHWEKFGLSLNTPPPAR